MKALSAMKRVTGEEKPGTYDESGCVDPDSASDIDVRVHRVQPTREENSDENDDGSNSTPVEPSGVAVDTVRVVKLRNVVSALLDEEVIGGEKSSERSEDNLQNRVRSAIATSRRQKSDVRSIHHRK